MLFPISITLKQTINKWIKAFYLTVIQTRSSYLLNEGNQVLLKLNNSTTT